MDIVEIKITKCVGETDMIKLIRNFDKAVPLSEIKRRLSEKDSAVIFDFDAYDWLNELERGVTAYDYERRILSFLDDLDRLDAAYDIIHNGETISRTLLENIIDRHEEIRIECEEYPD